MTKKHKNIKNEYTDNILHQPDLRHPDIQIPELYLKPGVYKTEKTQLVVNRRGDWTLVAEVEPLRILI